jgi:hypothetical protein
MSNPTESEAPACASKKRIQCKACPWRRDVVPERDIPGGYSASKHEALKRTIADPGSLRPTSTQMACHESRPGAEFVCVGWLHNQLGPGNNLALRMQAITGMLPRYEIQGDQHERFEDTLPKRPRRRKETP